MKSVKAKRRGGGGEERERASERERETRERERERGGNRYKHVCFFTSSPLPNTGPILDQAT